MLRRIALTLLIALTVSLAGPLPGAEARTVRKETIALSALSGTAVERGQLSGDDIAAYTIFAREGQTIHVGLRAQGGRLQFLLQGPLGSRTSGAGISRGDPTGILVRQTGPHRLALMLTDASRAEGVTASYVVRVSFSPLQGDGPRPKAPDATGRPEAPDLIDEPELIEEPEFIDEPDLPVLPEPADDNDTGGPDFWQVHGLGGNLLAVRSGPGTGYAILAQLPEGAVVENRGCEGRGDARWCRIGVQALDLRGWSSGRYLREAAAAPEDRPSTRPEGPFDAKGQLPCAARRADPIRACDYLLKRGRDDRVRLWVQVARENWRLIRFDGGLPTSADTDTPIDVDLQGRLFRIAVGNARFEVPADIVRPR